MTRRTRSRFPSAVKLASGVAAGGIALGLLLSLMIDPEMKQPAGSNELPVANAVLASPQPDEAWLDAGLGRVDAPEDMRPDLDYEAVVGAEWAMDAGVEPAPPPVGEAVEAARAAETAAAAAREASAPAAPEPASQPRKSALAQDGLY